MPDFQRIAAEFGLGPLLAARPLAGGRAEVARLTTTRGEFIVKPAESPFRVRLQESVALTLNQAGVRQARLRRTPAGSLTGGTGHTVQEFLPGQICLRPAPAQTAAAMRHAGVYHTALAQVPVPAALRAETTVFTRVVSPGYLIEMLPGLLRQPGAPDDGEHAIERALGLLAMSLPRLRRLPRQLVHGDIGPDNVLMDGDEVVAVIDFTPFAEPVLFAAATAVYWYHVHGRSGVDGSAIRESLAAFGQQRGWTGAEIAVWPVMLLREALRRLATSLAAAAESGSPVPAGTIARFDAVRSILRSWPSLQPGT